MSSHFRGALLALLTISKTPNLLVRFDLNCLQPQAVCSAFTQTRTIPAVPGCDSHTATEETAGSAA